MNPADERMDLDTRAIAGGATEKTLSSYGPPWSRSSYREDMNEASAIVDQEPVDVETAKPLIENTPIEGWNSDAIDDEAEISSMPDE